MQNQMLGSVIVAEIHRFFDRSRLYQDTLRYGLTHDIRSWESPCLCVDLPFNFGDGFGGEVDREEDNLGVDAVFGLGEEIGGDECWVCGFVGNNLDLRVNRVHYNRSKSRTRTSEGPAGISMETRASVSFCTNIFAAVTHWFPGPNILSTFGTLSVPYAKAAIA